MQGMVVVGLIAEELSNKKIKCVKYRSRSLGLTKVPAKPVQ